MLSIEYELTEDDAVDFGISSLRTSSIYARLIRRVLVLACLIVVLFSLVLLLTSADKWLGWVFLIVGLPAVLFVTPWLLWKRLPGVIRSRVRTGRNQALFGRQRIEITEDGVRRINAASESKIAWPAIERLVRSPKFFAIYISASQAFVIPRRALASPAHEAEFLRTVEELAKSRFTESAY